MLPRPDRWRWWPAAVTPWRRWPRRDMASSASLVRNAQISLRIVREDLLAMLYRLEELHIERRLGSREATQAVGAGVLANVGLWSLLRRGELQRSAVGSGTDRSRSAHGPRNLFVRTACGKPTWSSTWACRLTMFTTRPSGWNTSSIAGCKNRLWPTSATPRKTRTAARFPAAEVRHLT